MRDYVKCVPIIVKHAKEEEETVLHVKESIIYPGFPVRPIVLTWQYENTNNNQCTGAIPIVNYAQAQILINAVNVIRITITIYQLHNVKVNVHLDTLKLVQQYQSNDLHLVYRKLCDMYRRSF